MGLAASVLLVALVFLLHLPLIFLPLSIVLAAVITRDAGLIDCARRATAFRADRAGITLGALREKLSVRRGSALFIPWTDIEGIVLYRVHPRRGGGRATVPCIGVQRRAAAAPLRWGNEAAPGCPVPRVATWATRPITGWRLDRQRLAAVTAVAAPGIPIVDTSTGPGPGADDPGQEASAPEAGPTGQEAGPTGQR